MSGSSELNQATHLLRPEGILPSCSCVAYGCAFLGLLVYALSEEDEPPSKLAKPALDMKRFRPVVLVSAAWMALYYCFLQGQAAAAFWVHRLRREAGKESPKLERRKTLTFAAVKYGTLNANYNLILTMDRSVGNMLEQTPPFLLALWLHALTASAADAAWFGWLWLMLRALYPFAFAHPSMSEKLWGLQRRIGISWVSFVTWPSYFVVWKLLIGAIQSCY